MKLEKQVVSLELSKKLKELGVEQESLWYHIHFCQSHGMIPDGEISGRERADSWNSEFVYSAFTTAELGEMLPDDFISFRSKQGKHSSTPKKIDWWCEKEEKTGRVWLKHSDTEADCRAKMLIYLIENKYIISPPKSLDKGRG